MKKTILFLATFCMVAFVSAQTNIGLRFGSTYSNCKLSERLSERWLVDPKSGITAGIFADIPLFKKSLSFQPEINYVQKNTKWTTRDNYPWLIVDSDRAIRAAQNLRISYFDIPLLLRYKYSVKNSQFYINAGPRFSIGSKTTGSRDFYYQGKWFDSAGKPLDGETIEPCKNCTQYNNPLQFGNTGSSDFVKVDIGVALGLGYTLEVKDVGFFSIDARCTTGKSIFNPNKVIDTSWDLVQPQKQDYAKFRTWMFTLSYAYPLQKCSKKVGKK